MPADIAVAPPDELAVLIEAMGRGDEQALTRLHTRCTGRIFACAKAIVTQPEVADEVASACFMQAWRDAAHFSRARGSAIGWLLMIARSRALDALRQRTARNRHESTLDDPEFEDITGDDRSDPHTVCERVRRDRRLHALVASLVPIQRQTLLLAFTHGLTHQEAATHTNLPLGTIKSHINRGLHTLRERCMAAGVTL